MLKIKLFVIAIVLSLVGIVLSGAPQFTISAETDVLQEIAEYKSWSKITTQPITVKIDDTNFAAGG